MDPTTRNRYRVFNVAPKWQNYPLERWLNAAITPSLGLQDEELEGILDELCGLIPGDGEIFLTSNGQRVVPVVLSAGSSIASHRHPEHTLVYYVSVGDPPCAIIIEGERVVPEAGTAIYLPPDTLHAVETSRSETARISLAIRRRQA